MKTCEIDSCDKPYRARGLCATHYNQQHQPNRHRKIERTCIVCGAEWMTARKDGKYCSDECRSNDYIKRGIRPSVQGRNRPLTRKARARRRAAKAAKGLPGRRWVAGLCQRCGSPVVALIRSDAVRYCSDACKHAARASRRRARVRGAVRTPYSRYRIFVRDGWRCHICRRKVLRTKAVPHPRAPVIDHLIPLNDGGADSAENVATACFMCNSVKRQFGGNEQLALIG